MIHYIHYFIFIPFIGFLLSFCIPKAKENTISWISFLTVGIHFLGALCFIALWIFQGMEPLEIKEFVVYQTEGYEFFVDFDFDRITAVYLFVGASLTLLVTIFSRYYLHREPGYKRFFITVLFFYLGYNITIFSGNFETLFWGWEILGISSFLLIAFYRDRFLPVKNALKVFSVYRIGDVGLILAMWMSHHLWHENITFFKLFNYELVDEKLLNHSSVGIFISLAILLSAIAKSAQFPFSSWLPRAMEGPTPSSAIFYGSLSVHMGVFILLRTFPFWEHQISVRILIGTVGIVTALVSTGIARVQSSIKSQIAYASISQIGLIFLEMALGLNGLALFHFAGNAFLRTYQLLVSPSTVSYLIREQFFHFKERPDSIEDSWPKKLANSLYILCLKEWNLEFYMFKFFWNPIKWVAEKLQFFSVYRKIILILFVFSIGSITFLRLNNFPVHYQPYLPGFFSLLGLGMVIKSFSEKKNAIRAWVFIILNHCMVALAISFNEMFSFDHVTMFLSGILVSGFFGFLILILLREKTKSISLGVFHGNSLVYPIHSFLFFLCCLGLTGFPISPSFIGEDLVFGHIHKDQVLLAFATGTSFILDGLSAIRIFSRVFLGPNSTLNEPVAFRSS